MNKELSDDVSIEAVETFKNQATKLQRCKNVNFTVETFLLFKEAYQNAVKVDAEAFVFMKQVILTKFAKYLIEYIEEE